MASELSKSFETLLTGLEAHRKSLTERRRSYTKNLVTQTNEESRSGMPYVVEVAGVIAASNGAELFLDTLINSLRSDGHAFGESVAVKRALSTLFEQVKDLETGDRSKVTVPASNLYAIARELMGPISGVELRDGDS